MILRIHGLMISGAMKSTRIDALAMHYHAGMECIFDVRCTAARHVVSGRVA